MSIKQLHADCRKENSDTFNSGQVQNIAKYLEVKKDADEFRSCNVTSSSIKDYDVSVRLSVHIQFHAAPNRRCRIAP